MPQLLLALFVGAAAGALAGFFTALLQTRLEVEPILSGILVAAGLYTVNYTMLGGQSNLYLQYDTVNAAGSPVKEASPTVYKEWPSGPLGTMRRWSGPPPSTPTWPAPPE